MKVWKHAAVFLAAIAILLGIPALLCVDFRAVGSGADAVSSASVNMPDVPSGEFVIYLSKENHSDSLNQWAAFFREEDYGILLEDVHCLVANGDAAAIQLAERYQGRLVKDQMAVREDDGILVASRLAHGICDMVVASREMAEAIGLPKDGSDAIAVFRIQGDAS